MTTVTISKKTNQDEELIAIPKKEYREFSRWQKMFKTFKPIARDGEDLKKARADYKSGRYMSINELKRKLANKN